MAAVLDKNRTYGAVYGHPKAVFEQDNMLFDGGGNQVSVGPTPPLPTSFAKDEEEEDTTQHTAAQDAVESAKEFLRNVLKNGPLRKVVLFKEAENNNQQWDAVKNAANEMNLVRYKYKSEEMWKLPEEA